jgi:hypothetical protein
MKNDVMENEMFSIIPDLEGHIISDGEMIRMEKDGAILIRGQKAGFRAKQ